MASGTYRTRRDSLTQLSNVSLYGDATTTGFLLIGVKGNNLFPENKYRIDYDFYLYTFPSDFWGIGYDNGNNNANKSSYNRLETILLANWLARFHRNLYGGISTGFNWVKGSHFTKPELLNGEPHEVISTSVGLVLTYDSRDFIPNAARGIYLNINQRFFPRFLGNKNPFTRTAFVFDAYQRLWKGAILAFDLHGEFNYGDVPWNMLASLGGSTRMAGYYEGRYRDKNLIETQLELRQHIWRRNGIAVWVGAGNIFPSFSGFKWSHTLPNYGIGYRWEFKNRVNLRLDYGFGKKGQSDFYSTSMKHFNRLFTQRRIFWIFAVIMLVPNIFLCFTEHLPALFKVSYILIPGALYLVLLNLSRKPGITFWALLPLHFISAVQLVLLYLFGNSIIASDMFLTYSPPTAAKPSSCSTSWLRLS